MSQDNVEIVRNAYDGFRGGDLDAVLDLLDSEVELRDDPRLGDESYHGHQGFVSFLGEWLESWESFRIEPQDYVDAGNQVVAVVRQFGRGKGSGLELDVTVAHVWVLRNGKIVELNVYLDPADALRAVGLEAG
jgi:uncharacterized protein